MQVSVAEARTLGERVLIACGVPQAHAAIQIDLLIEAELRGKASHGLLRLQRIVERIKNGVAHPTTIGQHSWRSQAFLEVDGERGLGPVVAVAALDQISARARDTGIAIAAVRNSNHLGMLVWYVDRVAAGGQAAIALSTSEALVHPWGGRKAMIGTNPIAIGVPGTPEPFILDMATGLVSMGQIHDHANRHQPIPPHWALDADGNPTTDPVAAKLGAIAPFGEAKGYALGIAFEVLVSSLTGAPLGTNVHGTLDSERVCNKGDLFIVIHSAMLGRMAPDIAQYLDDVRTCPPLAGFDAVRIPGERSRESRRRRLEEGIPVAEEVWNRLQNLSADLVDH